MTNNPRTRTQALKERGARRRNAGERAPFVKWPGESAFVEGTITDLWEGKFGNVVRLLVAAASDNLVAVRGEGETREEHPVRAEDVVNVGLNYANLKDSLDGQDQGRVVHIAFEGWQMTQDDQKYRQFAVFEVDDENADPDSQAQSELVL